MGHISHVSAAAEKQTAHGVGKKESAKANGGFSNALLSIYYALAEASSLQNGVALLDSKRLGRNAQEMEKENAEAANPGWSQIPQAHQVQQTNWYTTYNYDAGSKIIKEHYATYKMVTTNLGQIQAANFGNQVANGNLEILQNRIAVTQQQAQIDESRLGTHTNDAAQVIQEAGFLVNAMLTLTQSALQRRGG